MLEARSSQLSIQDTLQALTDLASGCTQQGLPRVTLILSGGAVLTGSVVRLGEGTVALRGAGTVAHVLRLDEVAAITLHDVGAVDSLLGDGAEPSPESVSQAGPEHPGQLRAAWPAA